MVNEYDAVKTLVEKEGYPAGTKGVVISVYGTDTACEVELWDEHDYPIDVVTYLQDEIQAIEN